MTFKPEAFGIMDPRSLGETPDQFVQRKQAEWAESWRAAKALAAWDRMVALYRDGITEGVEFAIAQLDFSDYSGLSLMSMSTPGEMARGR